MVPKLLFITVLLMLCTTIFKLTASTKGSLIDVNYEALPDEGFPLTLYLNERSGSQTLFRMIIKTYISQSFVNLC